MLLPSGRSHEAPTDIDETCDVQSLEPPRPRKPLRPMNIIEVAPYLRLRLPPKMPDKVGMIEGADASLDLDFFFIPNRSHATAPSAGTITYHCCHHGVVSSTAAGVTPGTYAGGFIETSAGINAPSGAIDPSVCRANLTWSPQTTRRLQRGAHRSQRRQRPCF